MMKNQLKAGVIISYLNLLIGNIIPLLYTPYMLSVLGQSEYGLYNLSNSVVGYMSLLSLGLGGSIVKYITDYIAEGDKKGEEKILSLFINVYLILASIIIIIGLVISLNVSSVFGSGLTNLELNKMKQLVILMSINMAISFPLSVYSAVVISRQRYIFNKLLSLISTMIMPLLNIYMALLGMGSIGLAISGIIVNILIGIANIYYCHIILELKVSFKEIDYTPLKGIFKFSIYLFIAEVVNMLYWSTDKIIIGRYIGTAAVMVYSIGATFNTYLGAFAGTISSVIFPKVNLMVNKDADEYELSSLFIRVGRLQYLIVSIIMIGFIIFGKDFISLWAGNSYEESYIVAILTMLPLVVPLIQSCGLSILQAKNMHKFRSYVFLVIAIINLILSIYSVQYMGIIGCALATFISYIIGPVLIMNWYYYKKVKLNIPLFWKEIIKMTIPIVIMTIIFKYTVLSNLNIGTWRGLIFGILIYTFIFIVTIWIFVMNDYEKDLLISPINILKNKFNKRRLA